MSGLLERIVRRRRASASSRLGPPTPNGHPSPYEVPYLHGHETELAVTHVNGSAGAVEAPDVAPEIVNEAPEVAPEIVDEAPEVGDEAQAAESLKVVEVTDTSEPLDVPEAVETPETEPEAIDVPGTEREAIDVPETEPSLEEEPDEPAPIGDESPTMEHPVLVLEELEDEAEADPRPDPEAVAAHEPEPVVADEPVRVRAEPPQPPAPEPHFRGRGRIRRRARYLRRLREVQFRDVGGFAVELRRFGAHRPDLLAAKIAEAAQTDAELRALEEALGEEEPLRELREAGIGGVCGNCSAVHGSEDQFCATCGEPVGGNSRASRRPTEIDDYFGQG